MFKLGIQVVHDMTQTPLVFGVTRSKVKVTGYYNIYPQLNTFYVQRHLEYFQSGIFKPGIHVVHEMTQTPIIFCIIGSKVKVTSYVYVPHSTLYNLSNF